MKLLFKNVTKYDSKAYNKFVNFHNKKYNDSYFFITVFMCLLFLYCCILNFKSKNTILGLGFIKTLLIFLFCRFYLPVRRYKKTSKRYENNQKSLYTFSFYQHFFKIDNEKFYYLRLYKVIESDDYFYLYFNNNYAALVSKNGFKFGNTQDFSNFIKKKCLLKYRKNIGKQ